ncbi:IS66 family insertion sequence element accessory protein TnpB [Bradyrhizobium diazoefficiens]|nr:IS66 family insertion sequence element accessory protein TnpB [Bradyrhizobium diazoefficiens]MBR0892806.1 IS66 family insertion sequence element accessory protein TnpB [Bradyrhizobium diazoefficiens]MBR0924806.1 IS66 family insertion sequence element accessory protein TnpB [Bradyrhizobium diazoefficiens]
MQRGAVQTTGASSFRAKRADRIKIVWWDGSGVCLYLERLEKARFCWPRIGHHRVQLNEAGPDRGGQAAHRRVAE